MKRLLRKWSVGAWANATSLYRKSGVLAGRVWAFANRSHRSDRALAELVNFDKLAQDEPHTAVGQISNAIGNLRNDCEQYAQILILNFLASASIAVGVSLVSDRDLLLNNKVALPILELKFPIFLIISFVPVLQIIVFISLCRSAQAIDRFALAIRTGASRLASENVEHVEVGVAMPALLLPPSAQLLSPVDRIISLVALGTSIALSMALTVRLLSAFGWTSQHLLLAVLWALLCIGSLWLPLYRREVGAKVKWTVAGLIFALGMGYLYMNTHTHAKVDLDLEKH